jgi:hypothetical protein
VHSEPYEEALAIVKNDNVLEMLANKEDYIKWTQELRVYN